MNNDAFFQELKKHENEWLALVEGTDEIVASGADAAQAKTKAEKRGYRRVILLPTMRFDARYAPRV